MAESSWLEVPREDRAVAWLGLAVLLAAACILLYFLGPPAAILAAPLAIGSIQQSPHPIRQGILHWRIPRAFQAGRSERIEVRIIDRQAVLAGVAAARGEPDSPMVAEIEVAPRMRVRLMADAEVEELSTRDQLLRRDRAAAWDFTMTPRRGGPLTLRLLVSVRLDVDGREEVVDLPPHERHVWVKTSLLVVLGRAVTTHWKWSVTVILIPLLAWIADSSGLVDHAATALRSWFAAPPATAVRVANPASLSPP